MTPDFNGDGDLGVGFVGPVGCALRVYLSGPMSGFPEWNFPAFNAAAEHLRNAGYRVFNPAELPHPADTTPLKVFMREDIRALLGADIVVVLPEWEKSKGARLEVLIAQNLGLEIRQYNAEHIGGMGRYVKTAIVTERRLGEAPIDADAVGSIPGVQAGFATERPVNTSPVPEYAEIYESTFPRLPSVPSLDILNESDRDCLREAAASVRTGHDYAVHLPACRIEVRSITGRGHDLTEKDLAQIESMLAGLDQHGKGSFITHDVVFNATATPRFRVGIADYPSESAFSKAVREVTTKANAALSRELREQCGDAPILPPDSGIADYPSDSKPTNPKDDVGITKIPYHLWPMAATTEGTLALLEGRCKYGRNNWREAGVRASIYYDALLRHMAAWMEGEDVAPDSEISHLGHALACLAILVDAQSAGKLEDDRNYPGGYHDHLRRLTPHVVRLAEKYRDRHPHHYSIKDAIGRGKG